MDTSLLRRIHKNKKSRQIGRGGTRGKTAGRGTKGQNARSGAKVRPEIRDMIKRLPKLRGHGKNSNLSIETKPLVISLKLLNDAFSNGDHVNRSSIINKGIIRTANDNDCQIKILSDGEITKKIIVSGCKVSASAKAKIEKAGGEVKA